MKEGEERRRFIKERVRRNKTGEADALYILRFQRFSREIYRNSGERSFACMQTCFFALMAANERLPAQSGRHSQVKTTEQDEDINLYFTYCCYIPPRVSATTMVPIISAKKDKRKKEAKFLSDSSTPTHQSYVQEVVSGAYFVVFVFPSYSKQVLISCYITWYFLNIGCKRKDMYFFSFTAV